LHSQHLIDALSRAWPAGLPGVVRLGIDLVHIPRIADSLRDFGEAFTRKLFTEGEAAYARGAPHDMAQRLAARFAAKEATIKALALHDAGIDWKDIEVVRSGDGACDLQLHGRVAQIARTQGITRCLVCLSHDGDYAAAVVAALSDTAEPGHCPESVA
jgi:holo-[acyl-carrier protein] synthase